MPRKSQQRASWVLWVAAAAIAVIALGGYLITQASDPFRTAAELDVPSYCDNAGSLRGNSYKVAGEVADSLAWSPTGGRLIAISNDPSGKLLPVLVTPAFNSVNIQKGQQFIFLLEVDENGILKTKDLKKS